MKISLIELKISLIELKISSIQLEISLITNELYISVNELLISLIELKISSIQLEISSIELEISPITLKISIYNILNNEKNNCSLPKKIRLTHIHARALLCVLFLKWREINMTLKLPTQTKAEDQRHNI